MQEVARRLPLVDGAAKRQPLDGADFFRLLCLTPYKHKSAIRDSGKRLEAFADFYWCPLFSRASRFGEPYAIPSGATGTSPVTTRTF